MERFVFMLLALKMYIKQYHWLAKGYENHILADKLEEDLDDYVDEAAELFALRSEDLKSLYSGNVFFNAKSFINGVYFGEDMKENMRGLVGLIKEILIQAKDFESDEEILKDGYGDYMSRLSNLLLRKLYLLDVQLKKYEDIQ